MQKPRYRGTSISVDSALARTARSPNDNGMYSPAAQNGARSLKWGLPGEPDSPGGLFASDRSQSPRSMIVLNEGPTLRSGPASGVENTVSAYPGTTNGPTLNRRRARSVMPSGCAKAAACNRPHDGGDPLGPALARSSSTAAFREVNSR